MSEQQVPVRIVLNGEKRFFTVGQRETLLHLIRERAGLNGTKRGCDVGECGASTVIMDGKAVNSCCVFAAQCDGARVETIEGIGTPENPHPLQKAFMEAGAIQCGFCTPGMIMAAKALLDRVPHPSEEEIRTAMSGNLCRCTGYVKIEDAIKRAASVMYRAVSAEEA